MNLNIKINIKNNAEAWHIADILKASGYRQTEGCYWVEVFQNDELKNKITLIRDDD